MGVATTSRTALLKIQDKLGERQQQVYDALSDLGVATNENIAEYLGWPINRVTGRVTELKRYGVIDVEGIGMNKSGHSAKLWSIRNLNDKKIADMAECGD